MLSSALAAGDRRAFAALYDRLGAAMLRVASAMIGADEAQDAVQDVFVALVRSRDSLPRVEDLDAYVFACLRNAVMHRLKRSKRDRRQLEKLAMTAPLVESKPAEWDADLERVLSQLPVEQREMIALKIDAGLTFAQIASVLGVSPNTAASRYRYAIEKLRRAMEDKK